MKFIKNFYFNKNKKSKTSEIALNWFITISIIVTLISFSLTSFYLSSKSTVLVEIIDKSGTKVKTTDMTNIENAVMTLIIFGFSFITLSITLLAKLDKRDARKEIIYVNKLQDKYSIDEVLNLDHKTAINIAYELNLQRRLLKNIDIESLSLEVLIKRIQRKIYPQNIKIITKVVKNEKV